MAVPAKKPAQQPLPEGFLEAKAAEAVEEYHYKPAPTYHRPKPLPLVGPDPTQGE